MTASELLTELENARSLLDKYNMDKQAMIDAATPPIPAEVLAEIADIEAEYEPQIEEAEKVCREIEAEVKAAVIADGATVKGRILMAVYAKGRTSWDTKGLEAYAKADPKLLRFQSVGNPSVSFRAVK